MKHGKRYNLPKEPCLEYSHWRETAIAQHKSNLEKYNKANSESKEANQRLREVEIQICSERAKYDDLRRFYPADLELDRMRSRLGALESELSIAQTDAAQAMDYADAYYTSDEINLYRADTIASRVHDQRGRLQIADRSAKLNLLEQVPCYLASADADGRIKTIKFATACDPDNDLTVTMPKEAQHYLHDYFMHGPAWLGESFVETELDGYAFDGNMYQLDRPHFMQLHGVYFPRQKCLALPDTTYGYGQLGSEPNLSLLPTKPEDAEPIVVANLMHIFLKSFFDEQHHEWVFQKPERRFRVSYNNMPATSQAAIEFHLEKMTHPMPLLPFASAIQSQTTALYEPLRSRLENLASSPWSGEIRDEAADLKLAIENGAPFRLWSTQYPGIIGFRILLHTGKWTEGYLHCLEFKPSTKQDGLLRKTAREDVWIYDDLLLKIGWDEETEGRGYFYQQAPEDTRDERIE